MQTPSVQASTGVLDGNRESGQDVRTGNVTAVIAIANIVKSSLGPVGLDKMLVDDIGEVTVTNDGATILKQLDVEHPAAKVLVELADLQDQEVGDGTTSVVILAAELLKRANKLVLQQIHPTTVIQGYRIAMKEACKYIRDNVGISTEKLGKETLMNAARTSMSSKIIGSDADFFGKMVVEAMTSVKTKNSRGQIRYPLKAVNILKVHGKSAKESFLVKGFAINETRASQQMPSCIKNAKIACVDFDLRQYRTGMGVSIVIDDPRELEAIQEQERQICKKRIMMMINAGANVILTTKGIDDLALKYFVDAEAIAVRRVAKEDIRRICKATGATLVVSLGTMEGEEAFEASNLGSAEEVVEEVVSDYHKLFIKGCKTTQATSIILRGANEYMLDEMERSVHDSLCVVKRTLESGEVVPGGGATEVALSIFLERFATSMGSREQLAIAEFADALLVIPKTLTLNAAKDASDLVSRLRAYHNAAQTADKSEYSNFGLNLADGSLRDNMKAGVLEPILIKMKSIQFATEAAISILRIDDMIKINPKQEEQ